MMMMILKDKTEPSPYCKDTEMPLKARVYGEGASRGVHGTNILHVVDVLESVFCSVIPVAIVKMLAYKSVRLHSSIHIHLEKTKENFCTYVYQPTEPQAINAHCYTPIPCIFTNLFFFLNDQKCPKNMNNCINVNVKFVRKCPNSI